MRLRALLRDSFFLTALDGIGRAAVFGLLLLAAREFGPAEYGRLSAILAGSMTVGALVDIGISTWLLRELMTVSGPDSTDRERRAFECSAVLGLPILLASVLVAHWLLSDPGEALLATGVCTYAISLGVGSVLYARDRSRRRYARLVGGSLLEKTFLAAMGVPAVLSHHLGLLGAAFLTAALVRVAYAIGTDLGRWRIITTGLTVDAGRIGRTIREVSPFGINTFALSAATRLDVLLVALIAGNTAAGFFSLGDKLVAVALVPSAVLPAASMPIYGRSGQPGGADVNFALRLAAAAAFGLLILIGVLPFVDVKRALGIVGSQYVLGAWTAFLMLFAVPFSFASAILTPIIFLLGKEHRYLALGLAASAIGTAVLLIGSAIHGSEGAAIGFSARQLVLVIVLVFLIQGRREARVRDVSLAL